MSLLVETSADELRNKEHMLTLESPKFSADSPSVSIVHERGRGIAWRIWPAAHVLTEWLQTNKDIFQGEKIFVEIGAGVGLAGIVCAGLGGITAITDLGECLDALSRSKAANTYGLQSRLRVLPLTFGNFHEIAKVVESMRHEFAMPNAEIVVLGSDLVYFESLFIPLAQTMREFALKFNADIFLAYKKRIYKNEKRFFHKIIPQHSLDVDVILQTTVHEIDPTSQHADGRVILDLSVSQSTEDWNTRIFRIKKANLWRELPSAPVLKQGKESSSSPETSVSEKKQKKGKIPCTQEKRGRIR